MLAVVIHLAAVALKGKEAKDRRREKRRGSKLPNIVWHECNSLSLCAHRVEAGTFFFLHTRPLKKVKKKKTVGLPQFIDAYFLYFLKASSSAAAVPLALIPRLICLQVRYSSHSSSSSGFPTSPAGSFVSSLWGRRMKERVKERKSYRRNFVTCPAQSSFCKSSPAPRIEGEKRKKERKKTPNCAELSE